MAAGASGEPSSPTPTPKQGSPPPEGSSQGLSRKDKLAALGLEAEPEKPSVSPTPLNGAETETPEQAMERMLAASRAALEKRKRKAEKRERQAAAELQRQKDEALAEAKRLRKEERKRERVEERLDRLLKSQKECTDTSLQEVRDRADERAGEQQRQRFATMEALSQGWGSDGGRAVRDAGRAAEFQRRQAEEFKRRRSSPVPQADGGDSPQTRTVLSHSPSPPPSGLDREVSGTPQSLPPASSLTDFLGREKTPPADTANAPAQECGTATTPQAGSTAAPSAAATGTSDVCKPLSTQQKCIKCGAPAKTGCGRCKSVHYCGRECQKKHWKAHKPECNRELAIQQEWIDAADALEKEQ